MVSNQFAHRPGTDIMMHCKHDKSPPHEVIRLKDKEKVLPRDFLSVKSDEKDVCTKQTKVLSVKQKPAKIGEAFP